MNYNLSPLAVAIEHTSIRLGDDVVAQSLDTRVSNVSGQQIVSVIRSCSFIYGPIAGLIVAI